jgi:hypothetical protein
MEEKEIRKQISLVRAYKRVFCTDDGKKVFADLCKSVHFNNRVFDPDPYVNAFNCGQYDVVKRIVHVMEMDLEELMKRVKDDNKKEP